MAESAKVKAPDVLVNDSVEPACTWASDPTPRPPEVEPTDRLVPEVMSSPEPTVVVVEAIAVVAADEVVRLLPIVVVVVLIDRSSPHAKTPDEPRLTVPVAAPTTRSPPDVMEKLSPTVTDPDGNANSILPTVAVNKAPLPIVMLPLLDARSRSFPAVTLTFVPSAAAASTATSPTAVIEPELPMLTPPVTALMAKSLPAPKTKALPKVRPPPELSVNPRSVVA